MAKLKSPTYFINGASGASTVIGYENNSNRVVRFEFTTGNSGATDVTISVTAGTIVNKEGIDLTSIPFYITTSATSHANANKADKFSVTGYITGSSGKAYTGKASVILKANTTYYLWFFPASKTYGWSFWHNSSDYYTSCTPSGTSKFSLSISAGAGSRITVNRTQSPIGLPTGNLATGAIIYKNDKLKITFTPEANHRLLSQLLNGKTIASGNTHTVSGNVSVESTAQVLASSVAATNAPIESACAIVITKYNDNYYHSLQYSFGDLSGYIDKDGSISDTEKRFTTPSSLVFKIPATFYTQIPNDKTGVCTITCRTYGSESDTEQLGDSTSCQIIVEALQYLSMPNIEGSVVDCNDITKVLTGDDSVLIRHKSQAKCILTATAKNSATISTRRINDIELKSDVNEHIFNNVDVQSFRFEVTDSRGLLNYVVKRPTIIDYIPLTCNPTIFRPSTTGDKIVMTVAGNYYRGSFGAYSNTLTLQYRYKESGGSFGKWRTVASNKIVFGISSYRSEGEIELYAYSSQDEGGETTSPGFDYRASYDFQVRAIDGASGYVLSTVSKDIPVSSGVPVFDWGKDDFNINVALMLNNENILNIIYPVGAVYMHSSDILPTVVSVVGTWESIPSEIEGIYTWKRTE